MKYFYHVHKNTTYCLTVYKGKTMKSVAKCDPSDTFDLEGGKKLSRERLDCKVAKRRVNLAKEQLKRAEEEFLIAEDRRNRAVAHLEKSLATLNDVSAKLEETERTFKQVD